MPEYESLESEIAPDKTQTGKVKHNEWGSLGTGSAPAGQETGRSEGKVLPATMANDLLIQPDSDAQAAAAFVERHELDAFLGRAFEEKPIWAGLYESIQDIFFPPKLPPLKLTSTPIPVPDRMAVKPNPWAIGISSSVNIAILLVALFFVGKKIIDTVNKPQLINTNVELTEYKAPKANVAAGGGGGSPDKIEAIKGKIPPREKPLDIPQVIQPPVPTIDVQKDIIIPDDPKLPNFGQSKSANVTLDSGGNGRGMGIGNGNGNGYGDGSGGNTGGGLYRIGGNVSAPVLVNKVDAEFSEEARRAKYQGIVLVSIIVDAQGNPQNPRVVRPLGMGLDEKALEAIRQYKFKPAMKDGKTPVPVMISISIDFHLY